MKFKNIQNLVPTTEHFDESAIVNEGGFLSVSHMQAIEDALASHETALSQVQTALDTASASVTSLTTERAEANAALQTANGTITSQSNKIINLEAQVTAFGKKESGNGTVLETGGDEPVELPKAKSFSSDKNPANQWADKHLKKKK